MGNKSPWLDRQYLPSLPWLTSEVILFTIILVLACLSRLIGLGDRAMSHDEGLHVYFSWLFASGQGFSHTPLMHGPLQFHLIAWAFHLFGDTDFTARLPHAFASILTIAILWQWRQYLGRTGALLAAVMLVISPIMLYYGRYARNDTLVALFGLLTLYAILRHLETGKDRYLWLLACATALHFTAKETAFILTAQAMVFLGMYLIFRIIALSWKSPGVRIAFMVCLIASITLIGFYLVLSVKGSIAQYANFLLIATIVISVLGMAFLCLGFGWRGLCRERSFSMMILLCTFVLPQLSALPARAMGINPLDYAFTWPGWNFPSLWAQFSVKTGALLMGLVILSALIGISWNGKRWLIAGIIFWGIYIFFYTSMLTNWQGFFTGIVGSLGYWLEQQGVARGNQPWYYYLGIQIPVYEFLPALTLPIAIYFGIRNWIRADKDTANSKALPPPRTDPGEEPLPEKPAYNPVFELLLFWIVSGILGYTLASEKMPWLTVHISLPMILLAAWGLGQLAGQIRWASWFSRASLMRLLALIVFILSAFLVMQSLFGAVPPLHGQTLDLLASSQGFLLQTSLLISSLAAIIHLSLKHPLFDTIRQGLAVLFAVLVILSTRTSYRAAFINYNDATEYLVYAHGASGIKEALKRIDLLSSDTGGSEQEFVVAYDASLPDQGVSWPLKWYLRHHQQAVSYETPGIELLNIPVILVDPRNLEAVRALLAENYFEFSFIRMVWPNQDYFDLSSQKLNALLNDPDMRQAFLNIWLDRDYQQYGTVSGKRGLTVADWLPSDKMILFVRKDLAISQWKYNIVDLDKR